MKKELRTWYDSRTGTTYRYNIRTGCLNATRSDGATYYPERAEADRAIRHFDARDRATKAHKAREDAMRSCGLVKVRGGLGGIYWE